MTKTALNCLIYHIDDYISINREINKEYKTKANDKRIEALVMVKNMANSLIEFEKEQMIDFACHWCDNPRIERHDIESDFIDTFSK